MRKLPPLSLKDPACSSHPLVRVWWINAAKGYWSCLLFFSGCILQKAPLAWHTERISLLVLKAWPRGCLWDQITALCRNYRGQRSNRTLISNSWNFWCKEQIQKQHCLCLAYFSLEAVLQKLENWGEQSPCYCIQRSPPPGYPPKSFFGQVPDVMQSSREGANAH